jgi:endoglucanase
MTRRCTNLTFYVAIAATPGCAPDYAYKTQPPPVPECLAEKTLTGAGLRVEGNRIVDAAGQEVRFRGVNRAGSEYKCVMGESIFDGPVDDGAILAMVGWHANSVRIPLNEDCWLGINGVDDLYAGTMYQNEIASYVDRLHSHGLYAIVELHWNAPGAILADRQYNQQPVPDADHSPAFWSSVADRFKGDPMILFDLYNEPFVSPQNTDADPWTCWRDGCTITSSKGIPGAWQSAGMQTLLDTVRATGAEQVVMLGGLSYANDLSAWKSHRPHDPLCNTAVSYHQYDTDCTTESCWNYRLQDIIATLPLVTGEIGQKDCQHDFIDRYVAWADTHRVSYLAWAWNTASCSEFPALIRSYDGTPTNFGIGYRDHLLATSP